MSKETNEFIEKIDKLCYEYGFEIWPTETINQRNEDGTYPTFTVHNMHTNEKVSLIYIDGDGRPNFEDYSYWEVHYISCEGNNLWTSVRTPSNWNKGQVKDKMTIGGCGDDIAEILEIEESYDTEYHLDFCE